MVSPKSVSETLKTHVSYVAGFVSLASLARGEIFERLLSERCAEKIIRTLIDSENNKLPSRVRWFPPGLVPPSVLGGDGAARTSPPPGSLHAGRDDESEANSFLFTGWN